MPLSGGERPGGCSVTPIKRAALACAFACLFAAAPACAQDDAVPARSFASLAEAVAAQSPGIDDEHLRCLASAVYFESQGEPLAGQLAVAQVILNRVKSGRYAGNVCGVITQRGQFGFVRGGAVPVVDASRGAFRTAAAVAKVAMSQAWVTQQAATAMFFNGVRAARVGSVRIATIGNHAFYR